jgi:hypothetical protein
MVAEVALLLRMFVLNVLVPLLPTNPVGPAAVPAKIMLPPLLVDPPERLMRLALLAVAMPWRVRVEPLPSAISPNCQIPFVLLRSNVRATLAAVVSVPVKRRFRLPLVEVMTYPLVLTVMFVPPKLVEPVVARVIVPAVPPRIALWVVVVLAAQVACAPVSVPVRQAFVVTQFPVPPAAGLAETFAPFQ